MSDAPTPEPIVETNPKVKEPSDHDLVPHGPFCSLCGACGKCVAAGDVCEPRLKDDVTMTRRLARHLYESGV